MKKNDNGNNPLLEAVKMENIEIVKLLIKYTDNNEIFLEWNEDSIDVKNTEIIKLLQDHTNNNYLKNNKNIKKLLLSFYQNNIEKYYNNYK